MENTTGKQAGKYRELVNNKQMDWRPFNFLLPKRLDIYLQTICKKRGVSKSRILREIIIQNMNRDKIDY